MKRAPRHVLAAVFVAVLAIGAIAALCIASARRNTATTELFSS